MKQTAETPSQNKPQKPFVDIHKKVTDTIVKYLENGTTPWIQPWNSTDTSFKLPQNGKSGKPYSGVNVLLLWGAARDHEFTSNEWASFKKWSEMKQSIRKGEKGTMVIYYDCFEKEEQGELKKIPFIKSYVVFNKCQLKSFDPAEVTLEHTRPLADRLLLADEFVHNTKAIVKYTGSKAIYKSSTDQIRLPKVSAFIDTEHSTATENLYATLFHELIHWTGNPSRLNREFGKRFGDHAYAAEEILSELGSAFLCSELGISKEPAKDHANYIAGWLTALKSNKFLITSAANSASKAVDYLKKLQP